MGRKSANDNQIVPDSNKGRKQRPALTEEGREKQLISLAVDLAEKQLREGTASPSVITHFLKLGSSTERLDKDIKSQQVALMEAKTDNIKAQKRTEEMFEEAIEAMRRYGYYGGDDD